MQNRRECAYAAAWGMAMGLCAALGHAAPPDDSAPEWAWLNEAREASAGEDYERAFELYERLVEALPDHGGHWMALGDACLEVDRGERAVEAYERALELGQGELEWVAFTIALIHAYMEDDQSALDWLERSLELGFSNRGRIARESLFDRLREDPRFVELLGATAPKDVSRSEGWRIDIEYLASELARLHAGRDGRARSNAFQAELHDLASRVESLDDFQVLWELRRLVALLGDGHTSSYAPRAQIVEMRELPIVLYAFSDGLFIIDSEDSSLIGREVVAFGGRLAGEALNAIEPYLSLDNPMGVKWLGPYYLTFPSLLREIGCASAVDRAELTLRATSGEIEVRELVGVDVRRWRKLEHSSGADVHDAPLYLSHTAEENFWLEHLSESQTIYVQFNRLRDADSETLEQFAGRMLDSVRSADATNLIVDLRRDNGGNGKLITPLVRALIAFEMASPANRLFVITGRGTFSACQIFLTQIEQFTDAIFVGEPSSSSPNFVGEETELDLPYSGAPVSISTLYWQGSSPKDRRRWIDVDIPVELSSTDYFAGRDPVMETVRVVLTAE